jgi:hypothetical protein
MNPKRKSLTSLGLRFEIQLAENDFWFWVVFEEKQGNEKRIRRGVVEFVKSIAELILLVQIVVNVHLPGVSSITIWLGNIYVAFTDSARTENFASAIHGVAVIKLAARGQRHRLLHKTDHERTHAR